MTLELPEELTTARAAQLRGLVLEALAHPALERGEELWLDARAVKEVDVAGLQILCAARRSAVARGKRLAFAQAARSAALSQAISLAGFGSAEDDRWLVEQAGHA